MSLILDALNKADNERNKEQAPTINSVHDDVSPYGSPADKKHKLLIIGLVVCIVLILALGFYLIVSSMKEPATPSIVKNTNTPLQQQQSKTKSLNPANKQQNPTQAIQQTSNQTNVSARSKIQPAPKQSSDNSAANKTSGNKYDEQRKQRIAAQYEKVNQKRFGPANSTPPTQTRTDEEPSDQREQVANIYKNQQRPTPKPQVAQVTQKPTPAPTPVATPPPQVNKNMLAGHPDIGTVNELPFATQKKVPTIMYREHNFPSSVVLNNKTLRKGQMIDTNLYLEEILQDGIILRYEDRKFKMPRLNSWVNM